MKQPFINVEEKIDRFVGRRTLTPDSWQAGMQLQALGASIQPGNIASIALVRRAGFRPEKAPPRYLRLAGSFRGHPTWSITAQRWRQLAEGQAR